MRPSPRRSYRSSGTSARSNGSVKTRCRVQTRMRSGNRNSESEGTCLQLLNMTSCCILFWYILAELKDWANSTWLLLLLARWGRSWNTISATCMFCPLPCLCDRKDMARNGAVDSDLALCKCSKNDTSYVVDSCWFRFTLAWCSKKAFWDRMRILRRTQLRCGEIVAMTFRRLRTMFLHMPLCYYSNRFRWTLPPQ